MIVKNKGRVKGTSVARARLLNRFQRDMEYYEDEGEREDGVGGKKQTHKKKKFKQNSVE